VKLRIPEHKISDFNYDLPESRIAKYPLEKRDDSKLLVVNQNRIIDESFKNLPQQLPPRTLLIFNDTKVIPARLFFKRKTGATIEIFLIQQLSQDGKNWKCIIGNKAKFKSEESISCVMDTSFTAQWIDRELNLIQFNHPNDVLGAIESVGEMPLPPYLNRKPEHEDKDRYQSVFAKNKGAVAAPTASLHFTDNVIQECISHGVEIANCTLHVGLGTFAPVKHENINDHQMHSEQWVVSKEFIEKVFNPNYNIVPVGTTSMRVVESLVIVAQNIIHKRSNPLCINQGQGYQCMEKSLDILDLKIALLNYMKQFHLDVLSGPTSLIISPGFKLKLSKAIVTNFHQPKSTLLLLIATILGSKWKEIYQHALDSNYRFLSYGDSSLLYLH